MRHAWEMGVLVGEPEGKRSLERPRHRWEDGAQNGPYGDCLGGGVWSGFTWLRLGIIGWLL
jgi:hypothetical protein